ncbi:RNA demethylase ALKBH10B-like isoform X2 [Zingiber officinale]|uniref:RNA demethylase ALKBH10B-like isoform X2 n=1 Tax=Zingiber officinale TaxID=94328 RepID=UPI001C4AB102|nr:RNA demethylase ALKBH10B-like isoform X2 [Zingiber officinale]
MGMPLLISTPVFLPCLFCFKFDFKFGLFFYCINLNVWLLVNDSATDKTIMTSDRYGILKIISTPKEFLARETSDGMMVNVVEGLKFHENFLDSSEVTELVSLANELRAAGHRGELPGQTLVALRRPMTGHGREMIQLGVLINEEPIEDGNTIVTSGVRMIEAVPSQLDSIFDCLVQLQVLPVKPDFCLIDFFHEARRG